MCGRTARMQSSNATEDISCRTARRSERTNISQTHTQSKVDRNKITRPEGYYRYSEVAGIKKTDLSLSALRSKRGLGSRDIQMNQYRLFSFSKINLVSSRSLRRPPRFSITSFLFPNFYYPRICPSEDISDIKKIISSPPGCFSDEVYFVDSIFLLLTNSRSIGTRSTLAAIFAIKARLEE